MRFIEKIRWIIAAFTKGAPVWDEVNDLYPLPDWENEYAVRQWLLETCDVGDVAADFTATDLDDKAAIGARALVTNDETWPLIWSLIKRNAEPGVPLETMDVIAALSEIELEDKTKLDPITIVSLIFTLIKIIKHFRNKKNKE